MEKLKATFEEYAVASMSQTRAIGKAYRNLLGFVMKSAGYADTPAEEMDGVHFTEAQVVDNRLKPISAEQFKKLLARMDSDADALVEARKYFTFTDKQEAELKAKLG
jgi:hypothetical protein